MGTGWVWGLWHGYGVGMGSQGGYGVIGMGTGWVWGLWRGYGVVGMGMGWAWGRGGGDGANGVGNRVVVMGMGMCGVVLWGGAVGCCGAMMWGAVG